MELIESGLPSQMENRPLSDIVSHNDIIQNSNFGKYSLKLLGGLKVIMPPVIIRVKWLFFSVDHGDQRVYGIFKRDGIFKKDEAPNNHLTPKKGGFFSFCDVGTHLIVVYKTHLYSFFDRVM